MYAGQNTGMISCIMLTAYIVFSKFIIKKAYYYDVTFSGEAWKDDIERESRNHHRKSHNELAKYLRTYLTNRYPNVLWVVVVYDDVAGWHSHTVKGYYKHLFRHHGHNIVVSRIVRPYTTKAPSNLKNKFWAAFKPKWDRVCKNSWCWGKKDRLNARPSVDATWDNLYRQGVRPIMVHMIRGGASWGYSWSGGARVYCTKLKDGGLAIVLAVQK